jgi:hypothetical protein
MPASVFQHMLRAERFLPPKGRRGDFKAPLLGEVDLHQGQDPLLATNARGVFLPTSTSRTGVARFGFSPCSFEEEPRLLRRLYEWLWTQQKWPLRCSGIQTAVDRFRSLGLEAKVIVVSAIDAPAMIGKSEPVPEGFAGVVNGMKVLVSDLPKGAALVTVGSDRLGIYTRVEDHLGLLFQRIDQNMVVVDDVAR